MKQRLGKRGAGQHLAPGHDLLKHGQKMVVFGELVAVGRVHAVIQGQRIARFAAAVPEVDQPDAGDHAVGVARVLALGQLHKFAVALVLYAVVYEQEGFGRVAQQRLHEVAQLADWQIAGAPDSPGRGLRQANAPLGGYRCSF